MKVKGVKGVHDYLLKEVQSVYRLQGVDINDKHIEIMIRQMLKKVKIEEPGDGDMLPGSMVDTNEFDVKNEALIAAGKEPATASPVLLGITKRLWLRIPSFPPHPFQETTRVLTDAAIKGKVDPLIGLKENVIIGKLIPAGTGMSCYRNVSLTGLEEESITPKSMPEAVVYPEQEDENLPENTLDNDTLE